MKVELLLTPPQVLFLSAILNSFVEDHRSQFIAMNRREKAVYTISLDVADKLFNKARAIERKPKSKKLIKMTFKYHEAHGINFFVERLKDGNNENSTDTYFNSLAQNIYNQLDEKLN